jgi:tetratricopeptide (TPR) repeat protein
MVKEFDKAKLEERKGHYRNAMNAYLSLWSSSHAFLPSNVQKDLLHHILSTRQHVHPLPPTPEAFRKEMVMGLADIRDAHNQNAYRRALSHFQNASQLVPWAPQPYEAIGHVEEALQNYPEAIEALKMLLEINPNGPSARSTRDHIYELEEKSKGY